MDRTHKLSSELREKDSEVLAIVAGLRPSREGGARVEGVEVDVGGRQGLIVHNYGAGGTGFQAGYGMALEAVEAAATALKDIQHAGLKSRL